MQTANQPVADSYTPSHFSTKRTSYSVSTVSSPLHTPSPVPTPSHLTTMSESSPLLQYTALASFPGRLCEGGNEANSVTVHMIALFSLTPLHPAFLSPSRLYTLHLSFPPPSPFLPPSPLSFPFPPPPPLFRASLFPSLLPSLFSFLPLFPFSCSPPSSLSSFPPSFPPAPASLFPSLSLPQGEW